MKERELKERRARWAGKSAMRGKTEAAASVDEGDKAASLWTNWVAFRSCPIFYELRTAVDVGHPAL